MQREVLESARFPTIRFQSSEIAGTRVANHQQRLRVNGKLTLHGVTQTLNLDVMLTAYADGVRFQGEFPLTLSAFAIRPVTAVGGGIQLKDQLQVAFDLAGLPMEHP
jgi:polyisoprenoid-binding protein YceI